MRHYIHGPRQYKPSDSIDTTPKFTNDRRSALAIRDGGRPRFGGLRRRRTIATLHGMKWLIGTDEAGYGPNLGPLVVSASVWGVSDDVDHGNLYEQLSEVIVQRTANRWGRQVAMADSKLLYSPGKRRRDSGNGLRNLELGLLAAMGAVGLEPCSWRELWRWLAPGSVEAMRVIPWLADYETHLPIDCRAEQCAAAADALLAGLNDAGVRLVGVRSRAVFVEEFNSLIDRYGSKGTALSLQTFGLIGDMIESLPSGPISILCDKHGGRNRYGPLLAKQFPGATIEVRGEGREASRYRLVCDRPDICANVCFRTKAESCLPVALASMASKYLRELAMRAFNEFWLRRVPDLRPTAGYPQDAKRFRADVADEQRRLHIDDRILWRSV